MTFPIRCILTVKLAAELHAERSNHFDFNFPENFSNWPGHQRDEFQTFSTCQLLTRLHLSYNKQMIGRLRVCVCGKRREVFERPKSKLINIDGQSNKNQSLIDR